jgi:hypothetical protein
MFWDDRRERACDRLHLDVGRAALALLLPRDLRRGRLSVARFSMNCLWALSQSSAAARPELAELALLVDAT